MLRFLVILLCIFSFSSEILAANGKKENQKVTKSETAKAKSSRAKLRAKTSGKTSRKYASLKSANRKKIAKKDTDTKVKFIEDKPSSAPPLPASNQKVSPSNQIKDPEPLDDIDLASFEAVGPFNHYNDSNYFALRSDGYKSVLTLDRDMQSFSEELLRNNHVPSGAIVALDPRTGAVKALAGYSDGSPNGQAIATRNTFPAASLFKIITAAAAVETSGYNSETEVAFRGGTYSLGPHNYLPNNRADKRRMSLGLALGKSCNPVFARVALNNLSVDVIKKYANNFGFSKNLSKDFPLRPSTLDLDNNSYSLARTAAGFGAAYISPVHASAIAGAVGNHGLMMRPFIIDHVNDSKGKVVSRTIPEPMAQAISESTAREVLDMMTITVSEGTARKHFRKASDVLRNVPVAGKTGTLKGTSPKGLYLWFVAVAPAYNPKVAIATLVIDNGRSRINGVGLGKQFLERYFREDISTEQASSKEDDVQKKVDPLS